MYEYVKSSKGYAIFFVEDGRKEYVSDGLTLKQAKKWTQRLNDAYNKGYASHW